jgi:hypothetical protein
VAGSPTTFAELIQRIAGDPGPDQLQHRPVFARGLELDAAGEVSGGDWWAILHSTSSSGIVLIHAQAITAGQLKVQIDVPPDAVLSVVLDVKSTRRLGDLFETVAEFVGFGASPDAPQDSTSAGN